MKSERAKTAHELLGKPLVRWVVDAARAAGSERIITVVGHQREQVIPLVEDTTIVVQEERLGTGHAIMIAREAIKEAQAASPGSSLVVLAGDTPLLTPQTIAALAAAQSGGQPAPAAAAQAGAQSALEQATPAALSVLTFFAANPKGYGRIVRDPTTNTVLRIVEDRDATPDERSITECNSGAYCFDSDFLLNNLGRLTNNNAQGEYYLTDLLGLAVADGLFVGTHIVEEAETAGINSRVQLAQASKVMQRRINESHLEAGVTMLDPDLVWIAPDVSIAPDVELLPLTMLAGATSIAAGSTIGPNTRITDSRIGRNCRVEESVLDQVALEDGVSVGPRAYLRPGTLMRQGSKAGTHVEIKNSTIGPGSKVPHLSYLGDTTLGEDVNIGAGSITCNYDGSAKNPTVVGDRAFIGSDTMLVAPVTIGADTVIGAGSVITRDVPDGALAIERTEQTIREGWVEKHTKEQE
jgi:bifunctional UDP-N-acetylglucosamine pyrophosphorylase/glucosamine-1-phosphate N-acetyltransferase